MHAGCSRGTLKSPSENFPSSFRSPSHSPILKNSLHQAWSRRAQSFLRNCDKCPAERHAREHHRSQRSDHCHDRACRQTSLRSCIAAGCLGLLFSLSLPEALVIASLAVQCSLTNLRLTLSAACSVFTRLSLVSATPRLFWQVSRPQVPPLLNQQSNVPQRHSHKSSTPQTSRHLQIPSQVGTT